MTVVTLCCDTNLVRLHPDIGGSVSAFLHDGNEILRSASPAAIATRDPLGMACFPMTPFVNRIAQGRFVSGGCVVHIHQPETKHPMHGQGWRQSWNVVEQAGASATLELDGGGDEWPWRYKTRQQFELTSTSLDVQLDVKNLSETTMPASLGLHPYFPDLASASLRAGVSGMWETDEELIPTRWRNLEHAPAFRTLQPLANSDLDNCFTHFQREASISWPDRPGIRILSHGCNFVQVYTRGKDGSFCVEAQTAMPDAMNMIGQPHSGLALVKPGESFGCFTRFVLE